MFYLLRETLFGRKNGWLILWLLLVIVGIFSTFGPAPGSIEGLIYTTLPLRDQLSGGLLEVHTQSFLFAGLLYYWVNHPEKRWLSWALGAPVERVQRRLNFPIQIERGYGNWHALANTLGRQSPQRRSSPCFHQQTADPSPGYTGLGSLTLLICRASLTKKRAQRNLPLPYAAEASPSSWC